MKRSALTVACMCSLLCCNNFGALQASAALPDKQWNDVCTAANKEDWTNALKLASRCLKEMPPDDERLPRLRYLYMFAAAGTFSEGKMDYDDLASRMKELVGKEVVLPYREITNDRHFSGFNFLSPSDESGTKMMISA